MQFQPDTIHIEDHAERFALTQKILERFPDSEVIFQSNQDSALEFIKQTSNDVFGEAKKHLLLSRFKGSFLKKCPGISPGMVCCNYYIVNLMSNCIFDCSYCILQDFLENNPILQAYVNIEEVLDELQVIFTQNPNRVYRVGTGELADSLALDNVIPHSDILIPFLNRQENAVLELKTKSACVENLLNHNPKNVVVSWSINPKQIVEQEEKLTASLNERLQAAGQCREKGYRIGFHFDPVILFKGWEQAYKETVSLLFETVPEKQIEWISLGSFRFRQNLKRIMKERHPETILFSSEHVASKDGKYRYLRPLRNHAYETIRRYIRKYSEETSIYLCMETKEIWEDVTGTLPRSDLKLDQFFSTEAEKKNNPTQRRV